MPLPHAPDTRTNAITVTKLCLFILRQTVGRSAFQSRKRALTQTTLAGLAAHHADARREGRNRQDYGESICSGNWVAKPTGIGRSRKPGSNRSSSVDSRPLSAGRRPVTGVHLKNVFGYRIEALETEPSPMFPTGPNGGGASAAGLSPLDNCLASRASGECVPLWVSHTRTANREKPIRARGSCS